jgi:hypothetical protein
MTEPAAPVPDDRDWTVVLREPCPECGFDSASVSRSELPHLTRDAAAVLAGATSHPGGATRPAPAVWSPLEYGCHTLDV